MLQVFFGNFYVALCAKLTHESMQQAFFCNNWCHYYSNLDAPHAHIYCVNNVPNLIWHNLDLKLDGTIRRLSRC